MNRFYTHVPVVPTPLNNMRYIEVFKTDIAEEQAALQLTQLLRHNYPGYKVNFDLEDCDHILRIESRDKSIDNQGINSICIEAGFTIEVLTD
jgi:hypothetical protein